MTNDETSSQQSYDLFFSYSTKDQTDAYRLVELIEERGLKCWIAPRNIPTAESWAGSIIEGISHSTTFALFLTEHSNESKQVLREVERAVNNGMTILPIRMHEVELSNDLQYYLSTIQWLDAKQDLLPDCAERVVDVVNGAAVQTHSNQRSAAVANRSAKAEAESAPLATWYFVVLTALLGLLWIGTVIVLPYSIYRDGGRGQDGWEYVMFCVKHFPHVTAYPLLFSFSFPCLAIAAIRAAPYLWSRRTLIAIVCCACFGVLFAFDEMKPSSGSQMIFNIDESFLRNEKNRELFMQDTEVLNAGAWESDWHARKRAFEKLKEVSLETKLENAKQSAEWTRSPTAVVTGIQCGCFLFAFSMVFFFLALECQRINRLVNTNRRSELNRYATSRGNTLWPLAIGFFCSLAWLPFRFLYLSQSRYAVYGEGGGLIELLLWGFVLVAVYLVLAFRDKPVWAGIKKYIVAGVCTATFLLCFAGDRWPAAIDSLGIQPPSPRDGFLLMLLAAGCFALLVTRPQPTLRAT